MSNRIEDLAPDFQDTARAIERELAPLIETRSVGRFMTRRTQAEQIAFFAQGRDQLLVVNAKRAAANMAPISAKENTYTVTNCDGVNTPSAHQSGRAVDYVALDGSGNFSWDYARFVGVYAAVRDAAIKCGADAGGSWMTQRSGKASPYADIGLGWDPPHVQAKA